MQKDAARQQRLLCVLARPDHPYHKFVWGNKASLKEGLKNTGIHLYERLREFHKRMYSSHYMTLTVQSAG